MRLLIAALALFAAAPAFAQTFPACAKTGARSVFFNGKPALKLEDVAACPPGSFEIIPNVMIEGQPMVHFNTGVAGCAAAGSPNVTAGGKAATTSGDVTCPEG
ncbi:MAG: hypothetical protein WCC66_05215 [Rhizobiaceae bacterium]